MQFSERGYFSMLSAENRPGTENRSGCRGGALKTGPSRVADQQGSLDRSVQSLAAGRLKHRVRAGHWGHERKLRLVHGAARSGIVGAGRPTDLAPGVEEAPRTTGEVIMACWGSGTVCQRVPSRRSNCPGLPSWVVRPPRYQCG